jgi:hypothetical protein
VSEGRYRLRSAACCLLFHGVPALTAFSSTCSFHRKPVRKQPATSALANDTQQETNRQAAGRRVGVSSASVSYRAALPLCCVLTDIDVAHLLIVEFEGWFGSRRCG